MQADELRETSVRRAAFFPHVGAYVAAVPTYVGGLMTLGFAAKQSGLDAIPGADFDGSATPRSFQRSPYSTVAGDEHGGRMASSGGGGGQSAEHVAEAARLQPGGRFRSNYRDMHRNPLRRRKLRPSIPPTASDALEAR